MAVNTLTQPAKILIIRTSAMGDIVFSSPFAAALRRTYPQAHIAWVVEPGLEELLQNNPHVDELLLWPKKQWQTLFKQRKCLEMFKTIRAFRKALKAHRFDWVIDLQGLFKSGFLAWLSHAPRRTGLGASEGSHRLMTQVIPKGGDVTRISSEYLFLAQQLGLKTQDFLPELYIPASATKQVSEILKAHGLAQKTYAVLALFTTRPQKHWFETHWPQLAEMLKKQHGIVSVIVGGPDNIATAQQLASQTAGTINLAGQTSIMETAALVQSAKVLIGVDTGITHMAVAFNTPAVMLFGSTRPYLHTCRENARVIWLGLPCSPCGRKPTCNGVYMCMRDMTPQMVLQEAEQAIGKDVQKSSGRQEQK